MATYTDYRIDSISVDLGFKDLFIPYVKYIFYLIFHTTLFTEFILPFLIALFSVIYTLYVQIFTG